MEPIVIDGRKTRIIEALGGGFCIGAEGMAAHLYKNGQWKSDDLGSSDSADEWMWHTREDVVAFLRSLAQPSQPLDTFSIGLALLDDLAEVEAAQKDAITSQPKETEADEPTTPEWLQEIGVTCGDVFVDGAELEICAHTKSAYLEIEDKAPWYGCKHIIDLPYPETRRDVWELLTRLGAKNKAGTNFRGPLPASQPTSTQRAKR